MKFINTILVITSLVLNACDSSPKVIEEEILRRSRGHAPGGDHAWQSRRPNAHAPRQRVLDILNQETPAGDIEHIIGARERKGNGTSCTRGQIQRIDDGTAGGKRGVRRRETDILRGLSRCREGRCIIPATAHHIERGDPESRNVSRELFQGVSEITRINHRPATD